MTHFEYDCIVVLRWLFSVDSLLDSNWVFRYSVVLFQSGSVHN